MKATNLETLYAKADALLARGQGRAAVRLLRKGAELGSGECADRLGCCYADAEGVRRDRAAALRWMRLARRRGSLIAAGNIGMVYADGGRWPQAVRWWRVAVSEGDFDTCVDLAMCLLEGRGTRCDAAGARRLLVRAATAKPQWDITAFSRETAMALLGVLSARGLGTRRDLASARRWLHRANVDGDYPQAELALSRLHDLQPRDVARSHPWAVGM